MIGCIWSILFGCFHKWKSDGYTSGTYANYRRPYIINKMRCEKCGLIKLVEKSC